MRAYPEGLGTLVRSLFPGASLERVEPLAPDAAPGGEDEKALGYGRPLKVTVRDAAGAVRTLVFRTQAANEFGHDRRADRFEGAVLAWDLFGRIPDHVRAIDVGAVGDDGRLVSLRGTGEPYLVTEWAEGALYADDLRRIARERRATALDLVRPHVRHCRRTVAISGRGANRPEVVRLSALARTNRTSCGRRISREPIG